MGAAAPERLPRRPREVVHERLHQPVHRVAARHERGAHAHPRAAAAAVTGPIVTTVVVFSRSAACSSPINTAKRRSAVGLVNVTASMCPSSRRR